MQPMQDILNKTYLTSIVSMYNIPLKRKQLSLYYMCYDKKFVNEEDTTNILVYTYITVQRVLIYIYIYIYIQFICIQQLSLL